uniref:Glucosylceramidase n=1 Tax=Meloidogyne enterolobii TaxID=390850 RepID=A0A6V7VS40_MELEN|nr:unnamed protein product [Meloidogyne enterolobii]
MANRYRIGQPFRLLAAPWASPGWMKTNGKMNGDGELKGDLNGPYYQSYAKYLKKFFDEYHANGIDFWALTIQNQPESGLEKDFPFQTMFMSNRTQREFAKQLLLPLFQKSEYTVNLKLIAFDDVREHLVVSASEIFDKQTHSSSSKTSFEQTDTFLDQLLPLVPDFVIDGVKNFLNYQNEVKIKNPIDGIGVHWYVLDKIEDQSKIHELYKDKFIISTEACTGFDITADFGPRIGNWTRGWMYGHDILHNLRNWAIGWIDWNICLNMEGGPNWVNNIVDAPILVDGEKDEFYKQPMFYFIAHFSKFIPPGSVRINSSLFNNLSNYSINLLNKIDHVAFVTPRGDKIIVLINPNEEIIELNIKDIVEDREMKIELEPNSIMTAIWN